jgi:1-acyl-sn-glycerol-3-phosphate acyltransferase
MKLIKEIFARIFALYSLVVFIITMFIVVIPICLTFLINEPTGTNIFRIISQIWMRVWLTLIGCPLYVDGRKHFKKGEVYVVCCNHNSLMDIPLTTPFIPAANKTIAKTSFAKVPFFGWIYRRGSILVDRNSNASRAKSFEQMKQTLDLGIHMCIYPEGTRNKTNQPLKSFYDGAFKLAIDKQKAILPCIILNTKKVLPASKIFYMLPHRLEMHFLPQVDIGNKTAKELKEEVYKAMEAYIVNRQKTLL